MLVKRVLQVVLLAALVLPMGFTPARGGGSAESFPKEIQSRIGDRQVKLVLTGTAIRRLATLPIYAVASYVEEGVKVRSAEELAKVVQSSLLPVGVSRSLALVSLLAALASQSA